MDTNGKSKENKETIPDLQCRGRCHLFTTCNAFSTNCKTHADNLEPTQIKNQRSILYSNIMLSNIVAAAANTFFVFHTPRGDQETSLTPNKLETS